AGWSHLAADVLPPQMGAPPTPIAHRARFAGRLTVRSSEERLLRTSAGQRFAVATLLPVDAEKLLLRAAFACVNRRVKESNAETWMGAVASARCVLSPTPWKVVVRRILNAQKVCFVLSVGLARARNARVESTSSRTVAIAVNVVRAWNACRTVETWNVV